MEQYSNEDLAYLIKITDQSEQSDSMLSYIHELIRRKNTLDAEERNQLSIAYKNKVGPERTSWRILDSIEKREVSKQATTDAERARFKELLNQVRSEVESKLIGQCEEIIGFIDNKLLKNEKNQKACIFYLKMKGDYYRYLAEFQVERATEKENVPSAQEAAKAYDEAMSRAIQELETTDPTRLGLALNQSVFYYEIFNNPRKACEIAKKAFDQAINDIEQIRDEVYKDSTTIMQLIRDNLTLWSTELEEGLTSSEEEDM